MRVYTNYFFLFLSSFMKCPLPMKNREKPFTIFFLIFFSNLLLAQVDQTKIDSLVQIVELGKRDSNEVIALNEIAYRLRQKDFEEAKDFGEKAIGLSDSLNWPKGLAKGYENLGFVYRDHSKMEGAMVLFKKSLEIYEELKYKNGMVSMRNAIGMTYYDLGDFKAAIGQYQSAIAIAEETGNSYQVIALLVNIGIIYKQQSDFVSSIEYYERALDMLASFKNHGFMVHTLIALGYLHGDMNDGEKAIKMFERCLEISDSVGDKRNIG